jgi:DNA-binding beta-propeller fold protein YncE
MLKSRRSVVIVAVLVALLLGAGGDAIAKKKKKKQEEEKTDPYAEFVWPPAPATPRIKLEEIYAGRADIEATSKWKKKLLGASPQEAYDQLKKPFAVTFDQQGRILVTDHGSHAIIRFDRDERRMDVFGVKGNVRLATPMGLDIADDGTIYVADLTLKKVIAFSPDGEVLELYGEDGVLDNPTDVAVSPDGLRLYVADSKAHKIVVLDRKTGGLAGTIGGPESGPGEFNAPTSVAVDGERNLYVVDQLNCRVQVFDEQGEFIDEFGERRMGYGGFVRPKDIAVDEVGFIYVTDNAFNNVQLFDIDFSLLTFIGKGGTGPGTFHGASGVAVRGNEFAVTDQIGKRVQVFRFLVPKDQ